MRFAPAVLLMPALALAACSSPVPATPDSAWIVNMTGGTGCTLGDSMIGFGDSNIDPNAINTRVTDGEVVMSSGDTASVTCAVIPLSAGGFEVEAQTAIGADSLLVNIPSISTGASKATPAAGTVTYQSSATVQPFSGPCNFYFIANTNEGVAAGKFWSAFACTELTDGNSNPPSTCPVVESYFAVESCGTTPIF
jgi:hypothetical protein